ncbi:MAG: hypothetical protein EAX86_04155 [Candidatus Heimdallarchaeota archaeon]|nr:hypothetical protein [Candidatus Heimdallarchaeota archaeon]
MSMICICLTEDPLAKVFSYVPGQRLNISINFPEDSIPDYYRVKILDHRKNSRFNRYGKGSSEISINNWPIPQNIREEHYGVWQVWIDDKKNQIQPFGTFFFVEHTKRVELPLLASGVPIMMIELPVEVKITEPIPISEQAAVVEGSQLSTTIEVTENIPVTKIKGLGKTYATRLAKLSIYTVTDFWNHTDRIELAEIMRITDKKLASMLQEAELILGESTEKVYIKEEVEEGVIPDDILSVKGIGPKSAERLASIGILTKSDLLDFENVEELRQTLKVSTEKLSDILASIGRILKPIEVKPISDMDPLSQPITIIHGIGAKSAEKLAKIGIFTVNDLINSSDMDLKGVITHSQYSKLKTNATILLRREASQELISTKKISKNEKDLRHIKGIGVKTAERLNNAGIKSITDLAGISDIDDIAKLSGLALSKIRNWIKIAKEVDKFD